MNILALVPARIGSKGIPKKNIKILDGKPLIQYSLEAAMASSLINKVVVSTESREILEIATNLGAEVPFIRPEELASDQAKSIDVVLHALEYFEDNSIFFDAVCLLQPTFPFRTKSEIDEAITSFIENKADSLISVRKVPNHLNPHWVFEKKKESNFLCISTGETEIISRRQELPEAYYRDGSIYITSVSTLKKKTFLGEKLIPFFSKGPNINLDTMDDWSKAEKYING